MDLNDYLEVLRRRWISMTIVALVTIAVAAAVTLAMTTKYTATTRLFFAVEGSKTVTDLAQGSSFAEKQMTSYAEVAASPLVLDPVIARLGLDRSATELARSITATIPPETVILDISVTDPDAQLAATIANAVGTEVADVAADLSPERADGTKAVEATTLAPALVPTEPSSPNIARNLGLGIVLGLLLGLGVALLRQILDTKVRGEQDVRSVTDSPLLGVIGYDDRVPNHPLILRDEPLGAASEAIRRLRTNLQFVDLGDRPRSIVVTSSVSGEGKSTTSLNLAVALADAGSRVILVDADLRRPSVARALGLEEAVGLTTVLIGRAELADVVQHREDTSLDVLPSGRIPPNPSEILGSSAMERLLAELTANYDVVILDSPPLLPVTDAAVLGKLAGGALVVAQAGRIHRPQLRESLNALATAGVHVHGVVLNQLSRQKTGSYSYYSGYEPSTPSDMEPVNVSARPTQPPAEPAADVAPKRARIDVSKSPLPTGGKVVQEAVRSHSAANGSEPPVVRRVTPIGQ